MTALPGRRRRSTFIAVAVAVAGVVLAGRPRHARRRHAVQLDRGRRGVVRPARSWCSRPPRPGCWPPSTTSGQLASMAVLVGQPSGAGRQHRHRPGQRRCQRRRAAPTACRSPRRCRSTGAEALGPEAEILLGLTLDDVEVVDAARLTALLAPGRRVRRRPPDRRHRRRRRRRRRGRRADPRRRSGAAAILTARDPSVPAAEQYRGRRRGVGGDQRSRRRRRRRGGRHRGAVDGGRRRPARPARSDGLVAAMASGPVGHRGLQVAPVDADVQPAGRRRRAARSGRAGAGVRADRARQGGGAELGAVRAHDQRVHRRATGAERAAPTPTWPTRPISQILAVGGNVLSVDTGTADRRRPARRADRDRGRRPDRSSPAPRAPTALFGPIDVSVGAVEDRRGRRDVIRSAPTTSSCSPTAGRRCRRRPTRTAPTWRPGPPARRPPSHVWSSG